MAAIGPAVKQPRNPTVDWDIESIVQYRHLNKGAHYGHQANQLCYHVWHLD
jgi:hypothetical protein